MLHSSPTPLCISIRPVIPPQQLFFLSILPQIKIAALEKALASSNISVNLDVRMVTLQSDPALDACLGGMVDIVTRRDY